MKECYINIQNVTKTYKGNVVLNGANAICRRGEITGFVGRNGSGKTVLFKCICGLTYVDSGIITVNGQIINKDISMIRDVGAVIDGPAFLGGYSGLKNLQLLYGLNNKSNDQHLIKVMEIVGLDSFNKITVDKYSLGMKQRLAIAQAIMEDRPLIILDEPMNGLDKIGIRKIRELILDLKQKGKTILLASHNQDDINILCDHVYEIDNGILNLVR